MRVTSGFPHTADYVVPDAHEVLLVPASFKLFPLAVRNSMARDQTGLPQEDNV